MLKRYGFWLPMVSCLLLTHCSKDPGLGTQLASPAHFSAIQSQILMPRCGECHSAARVEAGLNVASYAQVMAAPGAVTPYAPIASALYTQCVSGSMPQDRTKLSNAELLSLYTWIALGALND